MVRVSNNTTDRHTSYKISVLFLLRNQLNLTCICSKNLRTLILSIFSLFFLFTGSGTMAQSSDLRFTHLSVEDGLSQSTVKCILKDSRGYMWFGTRDGLNRYDGYKFTTFRRDRNNKESLSGNLITDLLEDRDGNFWVGTSDGLCRFDPLKESFKRYKIGNSSPRYIADLMEDSKGTIWAGTNNGLFRFNPEEKTFSGYYHNPANPNSLTDSGINKIIEDHKGNYWIATPKGLDHFNARTNTFTHYRHDPANKKSIGSGLVSSVYQDSKKRIWVATSENGISLYKPEDNSFIRFIHEPANENTISHNDVLCFTEDVEGRLWIGTQNGGLSIFDYDKGRFKNYTTDITVPGSLGGISVHSLYTDNIGNVWIGTWAGGISLWSRYGEKFEIYRRIPGLKSANVYAVTGDEAGNIWLGIEDAGLFSFDSGKKTFQHHAHQAESKVPAKVIMSLKNYNKDTLLIGYHLGGFAFYDKRNGIFTHHLPDPAKPHSIEGNVKPSLMADREKNIWIGDWGAGVSVYNIKTKSFTTFRHDINNPLALSDGVVLSIFQDSAGNIWSGTEGGLNLFDPETKTFTRFVHDEEDINSISHNYVISIFEDSKGNLWVGTGGGLNLINKETKSFTAYTTEDGLPNNVINSILEDDNGNLWLGTNQGLSRFNISKKDFRNYDTSDGLQGNEFNRNAAYKAPDGKMYFAGTRGFNVFHPDSIKDNLNVPPVVLTDLKIFNEPVQISAEDSVLKQAIGLTEEINLNNNHSVISIGYSSLNFSSPGKNKYAYRLEGFDNDWIYAGNKQLATYTNLDPGSYTFRVKASNNDGVWNEQGASLIINVKPPVYFHWWFKAAIAVLAFSLVVFLYQYRSVSIRRQNQKLMKLVDERTEQLLAKQEEINAQNEELVTSNFELSQRQEQIAIQRDILVQQNHKLSLARKIIEAQNENLDKEVKERTRELVEYNQQLEQFAFIAAHNLRAPVARILGLGQLAKLSGVSKDDEKMITEKMVQTAEELDQVVRDINTILEIRKNNTLSVSEVDLQLELELIKANLANEINDTKAEISCSFEQVNKLKTVKPYLDSILLNLISNAIKYRHPKRPPRIEISTSRTDNIICLQVTDNGLGINLDAHKKNIFTLYKRFHSHVEGKGMGLYLVKTQVEALGGKITVDSKVNEGTSFRIFFSCKPDEAAMAEGQQLN